MGDTSKYLVYAVNVIRRKDNSRRCYLSFGDVYYEIEFTEVCSSKLVISLSKVDIIRIEVKDMKKTY